MRSVFVRCLRIAPRRIQRIDLAHDFFRRRDGVGNSALHRRARTIDRRELAGGKDRGGDQEDTLSAFLYGNRPILPSSCLNSLDRLG